MLRSKLGTIRARLLVGFVLVTLLPTIGISVGSVIVGYYNGRQQVLDRLESVGARKELEIESWIHSLQDGLIVASNTDCAFERISVVLDLARDDKYYQFYNEAVRNRLQGFAGQSKEIQELFLLDLRGQVALSTDVTQEGKSYLDQAYFQQGLKGPYAQLPFATNEQTPSSIIVVSPIVGPNGQTVGVMAARASLETLNGMLQERTGLGQTGKAYLIGRDHAYLLGYCPSNPNSKAPQLVHAGGIGVAMENQRGDSGVYEDCRGVRVVGNYRWLPHLQVVLAVEQDLAEAFRSIYTTISVNLIIALAAVFVAASASLFITRSIANPIVDLAKTATQIADGNLERVAKVERDDEIGVLAQAFNTMTAQLRDLIDSLERRVKERTQALQRRALQLETNAQLGHEITSILDIDDLLPKVVELIRDAFGYYHVHIFLVDRELGELALRASTSHTLGPRQHLELEGKSLNSQVARTGDALIVNDVSCDARYLPDKQLPDTRSELVIPLRLGDQVIGTLDVHSVALNAFTQEDVLVNQGLADQIAIAIENARLYDRSRELAILEERTRLARELHDSVTQSLYSLVLLTEGWRRMVGGADQAPIEDYLGRIGEITQQSLKEMRLLIHELRPPVLEREGLVGALRQRLDAVEKRVGIEARVLMEELIELPVAVEEGLYRIAQEALNNALKHSVATAVTVRIRPEGEQVVLEVADNGQGFDLEAIRTKGGMGLDSMRERTKEMGGTLTIASAPGEGTIVSATVPVPVISVG